RYTPRTEGLSAIRNGKPSVRLRRGRETTAFNISIALTSLWRHPFGCQDDAFQGGKSDERCRDARGVGEDAIGRSRGAGVSVDRAGNAAAGDFRREPWSLLRQADSLS